MDIVLQNTMDTIIIIKEHVDELKTDIRLVLPGVFIDGCLTDQLICFRRARISTLY